MKALSIHGDRGKQLMFAVTLLASSCVRPAPVVEQFTATDEASVRAVLQDQLAAWNRADIEAFFEGYEPSELLVFTSGAKIRRGFDETRTKFRDKYGDKPATMGTLAFELIDVRGVGVDGAVVLGRWALSDTAEAGAGVFSVVLERQADTWRIIHDHTSALKQQGGGEQDGGVGGQPRPKEPMKAEDVGVEGVEEKPAGDEHKREAGRG
jgi:uncharacterized protein (TIGR02246 family)